MEDSPTVIRDEHSDQGVHVYVNCVFMVVVVPLCEARGPSCSVTASSNAVRPLHVGSHSHVTSTAYYITRCGTRV